MFRWLHISDLHFDPRGDGANTLDLRRTLLSFLRDRPVDALFITGDLRFAKNQKDTSLKEDAQDVVTYIKKIATSVGIQDFNSVYMVPGNHDLTRSAARSKNVEEIIKNYGRIEDAIISEANVAQSLNYFSFYQRCEELLYGEQRMCSGNEIHKFITVSDSVNLLLLNTCIVSGNNNEEEHLIIGRKHLTELLEKSNIINAELPTIALAHHGTEMICISERIKLRELLDEFGISLYLCGHVHKPGMQKFGNNINEFAVGCIKDDRGVKASFTLGKLDNNIATIELFNWESSYWSERTAKTETIFLRQNVSSECFEKPLNYIEQYTMPEGSIGIRRKLTDVFIDNKHVVLISDAGYGKSTAIEALAYSFSRKKNNIVVIIRLRSISDKRLNDYIPVYYKEQHRNLFLFLDGLDEIPKGQRNAVISDVDSFASLNPNVCILVTSRGNFYTHSRKDNLARKTGGTLTGFEELTLVPLNNNEQHQYMMKCQFSDDNIQKFFTSLSENGLVTESKIPFFFIHLVRLFQKNRTLLARNLLMECLIRESFNIDVSKFSHEELERCELKIFTILEKLATSLLLIGKSQITNMEYQLLIDTSADRELLNCCGIWTSHKNGHTLIWEFTHNNFKEYLAARYLSTVDFEELKKLCCSEQGKHVKYHWANTFQFLLMEKSSDGNWMNKFAEFSVLMPEVIALIEWNHIDSSIPDILFQAYIEYKNKKQMWVQYDETEKLAKLACTPVNISYLLSLICSYEKGVSLCNALKILLLQENLFCHEEDARTALFDIIRTDSIPKHEKRLAMTALGRLRLDTQEITEFLLSVYHDEKLEDIIYGIYEYLNTSFQSEKHIDYYLQRAEFRSDVFSSQDAWDYGIVSVELSENILKSLRVLIIKDKKYLISKFEEMLDVLIEKGVKNYIKGDISIHEGFVEILIQSITQFSERKYVSQLLSFFEKTNTNEHMLDSMRQKTGMADILFANEFATGEQSTQIEQYIINKLREKHFTRDEAEAINRRKNSIVCNETEKIITQLLQDNYSIIASQQVKPLTSEQRVKIRHNYVDALLDREKYQGLIEELTIIMNDPNLTFERLNRKYQEEDLNWDLLSNRPDLEYLRVDLLHCHNKEKHARSKIITFTELIEDWEFYSIARLYYKLSNHDELRENTHFSPQQIYIIKDYCSKYLNTIKNVTYNETEQPSYLYVSLYVVYFTIFFDFSVSEELLLDLLMFPFVFYDKGSKSYGTQANDFDVTYITNRVDENKLKQRLQNNLDTVELKGIILKRHIDLANKYQLSNGIKQATAALENNNIYNFVKSEYIKYLAQFISPFELFNNIAPELNNDVLKNSINYLAEVDTEKTKLLLEKRNRDSEDKFLFLSWLVASNSEYALNRYIEIVQELEAVPEYPEEKTSSNSINYKGDLTESIGKISNSALIPQLLVLIELRFNSPFNDVSFFSLQNSLSKALTNIAISAYTLVLEVLVKLRKDHSENLPLVSFCSYTIDGIVSEQSRSNLELWTIKDAKEYLQL